jgi:hypothetical protein
MTPTQDTISYSRYKREPSGKLYKQMSCGSWEEVQSMVNYDVLNAHIEDTATTKAASLSAKFNALHRKINTSWEASK